MIPTQTSHTRAHTRRPHRHTCTRVCTLLLVVCVRAHTTHAHMALRGRDGGDGNVDAVIGGDGWISPNQERVVQIMANDGAGVRLPANEEVAVQAAANDKGHGVSGSVSGESGRGGVDGDSSEHQQGGRDGEGVGESQGHTDTHTSADIRQQTELAQGQGGSEPTRDTNDAVNLQQQTRALLSTKRGILDDDTVFDDGWEYEYLKESDKSLGQHSNLVRRVMASFRDTLLNFNASLAVDRNDNHDPFFPACWIYDALNDMSARGCRFLKLMKALTVQEPPLFSHPLRGDYPPPSGHDLPLPFSIDTRGNAPRMMEYQQVQSDLPSYHWFYRAILGLYKFAFESETNANLHLKPPPYPDFAPGWSDVKVYYQNEELIYHNGTRTTPFCVSAVKGDGMIFVFRGTMFAEEWAKDWNYKYSAKEQSSKFFPGRIHQGVFDIFSNLQAQILEEAKRHTGIRYIMTAGHSLGGTQSLMHGYNLQMQLGPTVRVDSLAIGAPMLGDHEWARVSGQVLNQRSLAYVGEGSAYSPYDYRVGDPIVQYTCGPYLSCSDINTGTDGSRDYVYARAPVHVPFGSKDLRNTKDWYSVENIVDYPSLRRVTACHICSYMCFLSRFRQDPSDTYTLCAFDGKALQLGDRVCAFPEIPL